MRISWSARIDATPRSSCLFGSACPTEILPLLLGDMNAACQLISLFFHKEYFICLRLLSAIGSEDICFAILMMRTAKPEPGHDQAAEFHCIHSSGLFFSAIQ